MPKVAATERTRSASRTVRIFLSSTFRDFGEERDLLVRKVFPALRAKLKDRFVELVDVDLRWGITVEQAERGEVLPICLTEIDRARPYFIGMLGERYGWIPPAEGFASELVDRQPWLKKHQGGKSVTELEILHGVLNNEEMAGRAFFYLRSRAYASTKGGDYVPASAQDKAKQEELKARIRASAYPVASYRDPEALARRLEKDLWAVLDASFPPDSVPDAFERERLKHEAYAAPRRRLYLGGERYQAWLARALDLSQPRLLIVGASGGGKSALMANALEAHRRAHPLDLVHEHYLGASADAADPHTLVRRVIEFIVRFTGSTEEIAGEPQRLIDSLPVWLATASAWAVREQTRFIFALDAMNALTNLEDLRWFPEFLPPRIHFVISCLAGTTLDNLKTKTSGSPWQTLEIQPLTQAQRRTLLVTYLARYNKTLALPLLRQLLAHPLASNPLFIRTLAEELRLFGVHEALQTVLRNYLRSHSVDDLFGRVLERVEGDCGKAAVKTAMTAIWASRSGLSEKEILGVADLVPATWAPIRDAMDEALIDSNGRITFAHDYLRSAVAARYIPQERQRADAHRKLGRWFRAASADARRAEEEPWQWLAACDWHSLKVCMSDAEVFAAFAKRGGSAEMQPYWRQLEQHAGINMPQVCLRAWRRWNLPASEPASVQLTIDLADLLLFVSHAAAAFKLASRGVAMLVKHQGERHAATLKARNLLGKILTAQSRYAAAVEQHQRVLDACPNPASRRGEKAAIYFDALNDLSVNTYYLGHFEESLPGFESVLAFRRASLGPAHRLTFQVANNVANAHSEIGRYDQALAVHGANLAAARRVLGQSCPDVALFLANNASALERSGSLEEAALQYQLSMDVYDAILGRRCADILLPLGNLGLLRQQQGQGELALSLQTEALRIARAVLGNHHRETVRALLNLASATAEISAKRALLEEGYAVARQVLGDHMFTMGAIGQLGWLAHEEGDHEAGEQLLLKAHGMAERLLPSNHHHVLANKFSLGRFYYDQGDDDQALRWLQECLRLQTGLTGAPVITLPDVCLMLSWILESRGEYVQARDVLNTSLAHLARTDGPQSPQRIAHLTSLADVEVGAGQIDAAQALYRQALAIAEATADFDIGEHCELLFHLGDLLEKHESTGQALPVFENCLRLAERLHGTKAVQLVNILVTVAAVRELVSDLPGALSARKRVHDILSDIEDVSQDRAEQRDVNIRALTALQLTVEATPPE